MSSIIFTSAKNSVLATEYFRAKFFLLLQEVHGKEEKGEIPVPNASLI